MKDTEEIRKEVEQLKDDEVVLLTVEPTSTNKLQIQFAEYVNNPNQSKNLLYFANKSDERFTRKPRRGWLTGEPEDLKELFPDISDHIDSVVSSGEAVFVGNKQIPANMDIHLELNDHQKPNKSALRNITKAAKQTGNGQYMIKNGKPIFQDVNIVTGEPNHNILQADEFADDVSGAGMQTFQAENQEQLEPVIA